MSWYQISLRLKESLAITLGVVSKQTYLGLVKWILITLILYDFLKVGVIVDLTLDGIILENTKQKY